jgi:hypothetical protein
VILVVTNKMLLQLTESLILGHEVRIVLILLLVLSLLPLVLRLLPQNCLMIIYLLTQHCNLYVLGGGSRTRIL